MKHLIISFNSRNSLYAFAKILRSNNISVSIINTPRSIAISCGLSIKTNFIHLNLISNLIKQVNISGFIGIFIQTSNNSLQRYEKFM